jgi:hypothetical protein
MMKSPLKFEVSHIAPCGMNCRTCIAYMRAKNKCPGCRIFSSEKAVTVRRCIIVNCSYLEKTESGFCYECVQFPCKRMKHLDNRYRTKYNTSFIENLLMIKEKGIEGFLAFESGRRTCPNCGSTLSVHRSFCLECKAEINMTIRD